MTLAMKMHVPFLTKRRPDTTSADDKPVLMTQAQGRAKFDTGEPSLIDFLPYYEVLPEANTLLLNDGRSVAAVVDVVGVATEGRSVDFLREIRDRMQLSIQDNFDEDEASPWIFQTYLTALTDMTPVIERMREYIDPELRETAFTQEFLRVQAAHLKGIASDEGIFYDSAVLDHQWGGKLVSVKLVVYRWIPAGYKSYRDMTPEEELEDTLTKLTQSLRDAGVTCRRNSGREIYQWLLKFFNPAPPTTNGDFSAFMDLAGFPDDDGLPLAHDLAESLFFERPRCDDKSGIYYFNDKPSLCIRANDLRRCPQPGQTAGEVKTSSEGKASCLMDRLPAGSTMVMTTVVSPQNVVDRYLTNLANRSKGESADATHTREAVGVAANLMANKQKMYHSAIAVYIRGEDLADLRRKSNKVAGLMLANHLRPIREEDEPLALNSYLWNLPCAWAPDLDKHFKAMRPMWSQHITNLLPFFGRERGSGNPGLTLFNRGGEPILIDPWSAEDRGKNSHMIISGPSGAGKSVLSNILIAHALAVHGMKVFAWEYGASFSLLADYVESLGLKVHRLQLKPGAGVSLAPFADAVKLLAAGPQAISPDEALQAVDDDDVRLYVRDAMRERGLSGDPRKLDADDYEAVWRQAAVLAVTDTMTRKDNSGDDQRDILGELMVILKLLATGGDEREAERMTRADEKMLSTAIYRAAEFAKAHDCTCKTEHVVQALKAIAKDPEYPQKSQLRAFDLAESTAIYLDGFFGELFNSDGQSWPDADFTVVDAATLGREGYEAPMSVAYASMLAKVVNIAEKTQMQKRKVFFLTDESHLVTTNPILAPAVVKASKVTRKIGCSLAYASQDCSDYVGPARKLLNNCEWLALLVPPKEEIENFSEVRRFTEDQKHLLASCRKEHRKYVEGCLFGAKKELLFRSVPPSIFLALSQTDKEEKAARYELMRDFGISELEAALHIAKQLDYVRGIGPKPEDPVSTALSDLAAPVGSGRSSTLVDAAA